MKKIMFLISFALIVFTAFFMRFYRLDYKPLHHDEGSHWSSFINVVYLGGPLSYYAGFSGFTSWYLSVLPFYFMGLSVFSLRFMVALFGASTVLLLYPLRKHLGDVGLLVSASLLAVSPSMVYYSRHVSQYPFFVFFLLFSFVCIVLYLERSRNIFLYLFSVNVALLLTTHDLALVFFAIAAFFFLFLYYFDFSEASRNKAKYIYFRVDRKAFVISSLLLVFVVTLIMSSFFRNFTSVFDFMRGFGYQFEKSFSTGHNKPFHYYLSTFFVIEFPVFFGSILGLFLPKRNYFSVFVGYWVLTSFFVFSLIPYKIPWMFTIVLLPMFILAGLGVESVFSYLSKVRPLKIMASAVALLFLMFSLLTSVDLNYVQPTSKENELNYVGPTDDVYGLIDDLHTYLKENDRVLITAKSHQPLPFYLRENDVSYLTDIKKLDTSDYPEYDVFIANENQINEKDENLISFRRKEYELRQNYRIVVLYKLRTTTPRH